MSHEHRNEQHGFHYLSPLDPSHTVWGLYRHRGRKGHFRQIKLFVTYERGIEWLREHKRYYQECHFSLKGARHVNELPEEYPADVPEGMWEPPVRQH